MTDEIRFNIGETFDQPEAFANSAAYLLRSQLLDRLTDVQIDPSRDVISGKCVQGVKTATEFELVEQWVSVMTTMGQTGYYLRMYSKVPLKIHRPAPNMKAEEPPPGSWEEERIQLRERAVKLEQLASAYEALVVKLQAQVEQYERAFAALRSADDGKARGQAAQP